MHGSDALEPSKDDADPAREPVKPARPASEPHQCPVVHLLPQHLTAGGRAAFERVISDDAMELRKELDWRASDLRSRGVEPEHTAEAVAEAHKALRRRKYLAGIEQVSRETVAGHGIGERPPTSGRSAVPPSLLTVATIGLPISANFLETSPQVVVFALLIVCGVVGLAWAWIEQRRGQAGA